MRLLIPKSQCSLYAHRGGGITASEKWVINKST